MDSLNNSIARPKPRVRTPKACNHCRQRKIKCNGNKVCHNCLKNNVTCQYTNNGIGKPKRKTRAKKLPKMPAEIASSTDSDAMASIESRLGYLEKNVKTLFSKLDEFLVATNMKINNVKANGFSSSNSDAAFEGAELQRYDTNSSVSSTGYGETIDSIIYNSQAEPTSQPMSMTSSSFSSPVSNASSLYLPPMDLLQSGKMNDFSDLLNIPKIVNKELNFLQEDFVLAETWRPDSSVL